MTRREWLRVEPVRPCTSPDGHDHLDTTTAASDIPVHVVCTRCREPWQVVVMPADGESEPDTPTRRAGP